MNLFRRNSAFNKRQEANQMANSRPSPRHCSNGDEQKFRHKKGSDISKCHAHGHDDHSYELKPEDLENKPSYLASFTKGMPHNFDTGLLANPLHYQYFVRAIDSGDPRDFRDTPLGPNEHMGNPYNCKVPSDKWKSKKAKYGNGTHDKPDPVGLRAWESQSAGLAYELEGPDAQAVTMPPAPRIGSAELTAEMAEVYVQAILRDVPFHAMSAGLLEKDKIKDKCGSIPQHALVNKDDLEKLGTTKDDAAEVLKWTEKLKELEWFAETNLKLNEEEAKRRCGRQCPLPTNAFRGITEGDDIGPYLSQFLLIGNTGIGDNDLKVTDGMITYGAITIDQRVRVAAERDYMQKWEEWYDVQNAARVSGLESYDPTHKRRFIYTPRDLATYVHFDALYEAYLNACLIMLAQGIPFDPGIPFQEDDTRDHQQGFAHFGGPHILSLVTEVATRALKAVRFQKYNVHRRCRPEVLAARITKADMLEKMSPELKQMKQDIGTNKHDILSKIQEINGDLFESNPGTNDDNYLLPMAFCEGSPMHPAYGAGHATVAGACITILKAFFDCKHVFKANGEDSNKAYVSVDHGKSLKEIHVFDQHGNPAHLTVEGELNKLASNISIGRNWAGVHYFSDYYESLLMGEEIAIGILEEQKLMFGENFSMSLPKFCGDTIRI